MYTYTILPGQRLSVERIPFRWIGRLCQAWYWVQGYDLRSTGYNSDGRTWCFEKRPWKDID